MPQIIIYIITGYIFLKTLHFVSLKENSADIEHILIGSLVTGYVYYKIMNLIPFSIGKDADNIVIVISAVLSAYIIGQMLNSQFMIKIYDFFKIRNTSKRFLWDDIMDNTQPMKMVVYYEKFKYEGYLHTFESYSNAPKIVLASYIITYKNKIIDDNSHNTTKIIILDSNKVDKIEVIYDADSHMCDDLKLLCDLRKENR